MSNEYVCNLVWSRAGTTAVHHVAVCLLMPAACVLFDAHMVGEVTNSDQHYKKKKIKDNFHFR